MSAPTYRTGIPELRFPAIGPPRAQPLLALMHQLDRSDRLDPAVRQARVFDQLTAVMHHAIRTVPWWRRAARKAGIEPDGTLTPEALRALPPLSRHDIQDAGERLFARDTPKTHGRVGTARTSGSSGTPVAVRKTELSLLYWKAITLRDHLWHARDFAKTSALIRYLPKDAEAASPAGRRSPNWGSPTSDVYETGPALLMSIQTPTEQQARWLLANEPSYLLTYPSGLAQLLDWFEAEGRVLTSIQQVRTISEALPDGLRERCQQVLGARVVDTYSTQEVGYLALQCPDGDHYLLQEEANHVEVVRTDGTPCEPGEIGRVLVTPLHNLAMPLFRYDVGDMVELGPAGPSPCGRTLRSITRVVGRTRGMLRHPNGATSWPVFGGQHYRSVAPVRQWRAVQTALDHVDLEIVPERPLTQAEREALIRVSRESSGWSHGLAIVERTEPIPRTGAGKFPDYVCRLPPEDDPLAGR